MPKGVVIRRADRPITKGDLGHTTRLVVVVGGHQHTISRGRSERAVSVEGEGAGSALTTSRARHRGCHTTGDGVIGGRGDRSPDVGGLHRPAEEVHHHLGLS